MTVYCISYDLRKPGRDYNDLYDKIKSYGKYTRPLESMWLISTTQTSAQVRDTLQKVMDTNDGLLVIEVVKNAAWTTLSPGAGEWIKTI